MDYAIEIADKGLVTVRHNSLTKTIGYVDWIPEELRHANAVCVRGCSYLSPEADLEDLLRHYHAEHGFNPLYIDPEDL